MERGKIIIIQLQLIAKRKKNAEKFGSKYSTLLHSFVIFPMRKTIFGMRGCFPASHGLEMKDLIASRGRRPREAVNVHFQPK